MRVLVAGSKRSIGDDRTRCAQFEQVALSIGETIARNGHTLLLESDDDKTFDFHALQGVLRTPERPNVEVHRSRSLGPAFANPKMPDLKYVGYSEPPAQLGKIDRRLWGRVGAVAASHVVFLMGGATGTATFGSVARDLRVPIVAIPEFGGTASESYESCLALYQSRAELQELLGTLSKPTGESEPGKAIVRFAELLVRKQGYFLGYAHEDAEVADHIEVLLYRRQRVVFRDEATLRLGDSLDDIQRQLGRSDTYIGIWSHSFARSDWCKKELNWAIELQRQQRRPRRVHLMILDDTPLPSELASVIQASGKDRDSRHLSVRRLLDEESPS